MKVGYNLYLTDNEENEHSLYVCVCVSEHVCDWQWAIALWTRVIERVWTVLWERLHYSVLVKRSLIFVQISALHTELFVCKQSLLTYQGLEFINDLTALQQTHWHKQQCAAMFVRFLDVRDNSGQTSAWHDTVITMTVEMTR